MNTTAILRSALIAFLVLVMAAPSGVLAQGSSAPPAYSQEQLNQMLAPIALYPDSLLAQVLTASTFPLEVVSADRWVKQNKNLKPDQVNAAVDTMKWDLSVKALVPFPSVLSMMSERLEWMQMLGEAFLAQQADVMGTVQALRAKAQAQGQLKTTSQQTVVVREQAIVIEPATPTVVYVPAYDPAVVYGAWPYPAYPPYPYYPAGAVVTAGVIGFAAGVAVGAAWNNGWGHWNWNSGSVNVNVNRNVNINNISGNRVQHYNTANWNQVAHRGQVATGGAAGRGQVGQGGAAARNDYRGYSQAKAGQGATGRPSASQLDSKRPSQTPGQSAATRPAQKSAGQTMQQPRASQSMQQRQGGASAFQGAGYGNSARMSSDRGQMSRNASSFSGSRGGGQSFSRGGGGGGGFSRGGGGGGRGGGGGGRRR